MNFFEIIFEDKYFNNLGHKVSFIKVRDPSNVTYFNELRSESNILANYRIKFGAVGNIKAFGDQLLEDSSNTIEYPISSAWQAACGIVALLGSAILLPLSIVQVLSAKPEENIKKQADAAGIIAEQGAYDLLMGITGMAASLILIPAMIIKTLINAITASILTIKDIFITPTEENLKVEIKEDFLNFLSQERCKVKNLSDSKYEVQEDKKEFSELLPNTYVSKVINVIYQCGGYAKRGVEQLGGAISDGIEGIAHGLKGVGNLALSPIAIISGDSENIAQCANDGAAELMEVLPNTATKWLNRAVNVINGDSEKSINQYYK
jgi:hypothetical protein